MNVTVDVTTKFNVTVYQNKSVHSYELVVKVERVIVRMLQMFYNHMKCVYILGFFDVMIQTDTYHPYEVLMMFMNKE